MCAEFAQAVEFESARENALLRTGFPGRRLVASFLGLGSIAFAAAAIAKVLFFVCMAVFLVSLVMNRLRDDNAEN
jgi:uncharacterized membrane protein YtjA (UPF0391 family)